MRWSDLDPVERPGPLAVVAAIVVLVGWAMLGVTAGDPGLPPDESLPTSVYVVGPPVTGAPVPTPPQPGATAAATASAAAGPGAPVTSSIPTPTPTKEQP